MEQMFNIVLVKLAVGFIFLMVYRDILTNILLVMHDKRSIA